MASPHANRLLPVLGTVALLLTAVVTVRSYQQSRQTNPTNSALPKAPLADADSPAETVKSLTALVADMRTSTEALVRENQSLQQQNKNLEDQITRKVTDGLKQQARDEASQITSNITRRFDDLESKVRSQLNPSPSNPNEIPIGMGLEKDVTPAETWVWIDPLDVVATALSGSPGALNIPAATIPPTPGASANSLPPSKSTEPAATIPHYTVPRNATLIGSTAMTALLGRIPIKGRVMDPMPFKVIVGAQNLAANGITIPGIEGMIASGNALGDWTLSCVTGRITSATFVFTDGTIRTVSASDDTGTTTTVTPSPSSLSSTGTTPSSTKALGWISDDHGIPCISGQRLTDAQKFLSQRILAGAVEAGAQAFAQAETTRNVTPLGGVVQSVTCDAAKFAGLKALTGSVQEISKWLDARQSESFDAVFVASGLPLAIHIDQELHIDYPPQGRKVSHVRTSRDPARPAYLD